MKNVLFCIAFAQALNIFSQKHDAIIPGGYQTYSEPGEPNRFNFDFSNDTFFLDTVVRKIEQSLLHISICDSMGNLQLIGNGCWVADKNGNMMKNGSNITTGLTLLCPEFTRTYQAGLAIPRPGKKNRYLVLLNQNIKNINYPFDYFSTSVNWSEIDMSLNNGLGEVIKKNQKVSIDTSNAYQMTACKHANGRDWWVILPPIDSSIKYQFLLVDPTGVHFHHEQEIGTPTTFQSTLGKSMMQACFSPDGNKYIRGSSWDGTRVFDFDRCTGFLSNEHKIWTYFTDLWNGIGVCVSPNNRYLFLGNIVEMFQVDLQSVNLQNSMIEIDTIDGTRQYEVIPPPITMFHMLLGPDGKIYVSDGNASCTWHVIHQPNEFSKACILRQHEIWLPFTNEHLNGFFYPDINYSGMYTGPHWRLGAVDGSSCDTIGFDNHPLCNWQYNMIDTFSQVYKFSDNSTYEPQTWHWNFGDGTTSQDTNPTHVFPSDGIYQVCLTVCNQFSCDTLCKFIEIKKLTSSTESTVVSNLIDLKAAPNPTSGPFKLYFSEPLERESLFELLDISGKNVFSKAVLKNAVATDFDFSNLPDGLFFWQLSSCGVFLATGKVAIFD